MRAVLLGVVVVLLPNEVLLWTLAGYLGFGEGGLLHLVMLVI
jgi:hypothetical protein